MFSSVAHRELNKRATAAGDQTTDDNIEDTRSAAGRDGGSSSSLITGLRLSGRAAARRRRHGHESANISAKRGSVRDRIDNSS
jgi:hypothetical protein